MSFMSDNAGISNPKTMNFNKRGNHLKDGTYRVRIQKAELRNVEGGRAYIVEFIVLESSNIEVPVGVVASQYVGFGKYPQSAFRDMYLIIAAFFGHAGDVPWIQANLSEDATNTRLTCEGNVIGALGLEVTVVAFTHPQKIDKSKNFTDHNWGSAFNPRDIAEVLRMPLGAVAPAQAAPTAAAPPPPPTPAAFPPAGWTAHPRAAGCFFKGNVSLWEAQLRAEMAAGRA